MEMNRRSFMGAALFASLAVAAVAAVVAVGLAAVFSAEAADVVTICREEGRYIGWPTICRRANGELLVVFSGDRDSHVCPHGKVQMIRSTDDGRTWSKPVTIQNGPIDDRDAGLVELPDGTLLLNWFTSVAFSEYENPALKAFKLEKYKAHFAAIPSETVRRELGYWTARSTDGGRTWEPKVRCPAQLPHGVTVLKDGRLLYVGKRYRHETFKDTMSDDENRPALLCVESKDGGRSWRTIAELQVPEGLSAAQFDEPHTVEVEGGRLVCQIRHTKGGPLFGAAQTESTDGGRTWSAFRPGVGGYPAHLLTLSDGRLLSVYGKRFWNGGQNGQYACFSSDGGRTWQRDEEILLAACPDDDHGYPATAQLPNGELLTVFYGKEKPDDWPTFLRLARWRPPCRGPRSLLDLPKTPTATRNSEGDVIATRDGRLLMAYTLYTGTEDKRYGVVDDAAAADVAVRWSADGGETWSAPAVAVKRPSDCQNVMSVSLLRLKSGALAMFYCRKKSGRDCRPAMRVSTDEGRTWGAETLCVADADANYYVLNNARARQLKGGRLALPLALHRWRDAGNGKDGWEPAGELVCALSDDEGRTWRFSKDRRMPRDAEGKKVVAQEPGLIELKDGRLMMWARTDRRTQWRFFSRDGGETWSAGEPMPGVVSADLAPATIERLSTGDLVMVWNDHSGAEARRGHPAVRAPMTVAVSKDEGETWIRKKDLYADEKGLWTCYYAVRQFGDRLLILHCLKDLLSTSRLTEVPLDWLNLSTSPERIWYNTDVFGVR